MIAMKKLPLANRTFAEIIDDDCLYADKTRYIHKMLTGNGSDRFYLSRPGLFGKTLLLDTIKEIFSGNRERFKDLWIGKSDYEFPRHPVISLNLSKVSTDVKGLKDYLLNEMTLIAERENLTIEERSFHYCYKDLIYALREKHDSPVVVLIDDFDAPVTNRMDTIKEALNNAEFLEGFLTAITDGMSDHLHFLLVTGVNAHGMIYSWNGAVYLDAILMSPEYAGICGFTLEDFESLFADRMEQTLSKLKESGKIELSANKEDLRDLILHWYGGYVWDNDELKPEILNPYSVLHFFNNCSFDHYWMRSGRPTVMTTMMRKDPSNFILSRLRSFSESDLERLEFSSLKSIPALFQCGYLTFDKRIIDSNATCLFDRVKYSLKFPNFEVSSYYKTDLFRAIFKSDSDDNELKSMGDTLREALIGGNDIVAGDTLENFLKSIPGDHVLKHHRFFHALIRVIFYGMGFNVTLEQTSFEWESKLLVELPNRVLLVIDLIYLSGLKQLKLSRENKILMRIAKEHISECVCYHRMKRRAGNYPEISRYLLKIGNKLFKDPNWIKNNGFLSDVVLKKLPPDETNEALRDLVGSELDYHELEDELTKRTPDTQASDNEIKKMLTEAANKALLTPSKNDREDKSSLEADKIIHMVLATYGDGSKVKVAFDRKTP
jgi:hypothetical protein